MNIKRDIIDKFSTWNDNPDRKPILLQGARQTGKTWAMKKFGRQNFEYVAKFDFDRQPELRSVFQPTKESERLIKELALYTSVPLILDKTLMIFD